MSTGVVCAQTGEILPSTKDLHAQKCKDHNEEEKQEEQTDNGLHGVHQRHNQIPQGCPVP